MLTYIFWYLCNWSCSCTNIRLTSEVYSFSIYLPEFPVWCSGGRGRSRSVKDGAGGFGGLLGTLSEWCIGVGGCEFAPGLELPGTGGVERDGRTTASGFGDPWIEPSKFPSESKCITIFYYWICRSMVRFLF